jgi:hypothetical protein
MHIAINKIHPQRNTINEPYYDHPALGKLCEKLELEYGLERDNQTTQHVSNRTNEMERIAGIESLAGWIKRECLEPLQAAKSWEEMHQALSDNGLEMLRRGNGLVIANKEGIAVKASSVSRELSAAKLEAKLGPFRESAKHGMDGISDSPIRQSKKYEPRPLRSRIDTTELYARYKAEQQSAITNRAAEMAKARDRKNRQIEAAKRTAKAKRTGWARALARSCCTALPAGRSTASLNASTSSTAGSASKSTANGNARRGPIGCNAKPGGIKHRTRGCV